MVTLDWTPYKLHINCYFHNLGDEVAEQVLGRAVAQQVLGKALAQQVLGKAVAKLVLGHELGRANPWSRAWQS